MATLRELSQRIWDAQSDLDRATEERITPGMTVHVRFGGPAPVCEVTAVCGQRVHVRNQKTGREYSVDVSRLIEFDRL